VGDPVVVPIQRSIKVIAIVGKVEQVAQEADVGHSAARHHPVEDGHHIRGGAQRVWLGPAHRLQEYGCPDSSCRLSGRRQLLDPQLVLLLRRGAVDAVAVEGVECPSPEALPNPHSDVNVVDELAPPFGNRENSTVGPSQVAGKEVQTNEGYARVLHSRHEPVDILVGWYGLIRPRPPELHRLKSSLARSGWALQ
jgi:hypothetical protein